VTAGRALADTERAGPPSDEDRELVRASRAAELPRRYQELIRREQEQRSASDHRAELMRKHRQLLRRSLTRRDDAERELVAEARLVTTSLARFRVHPALAGEMFDTVLVDGAGAAPLAEVLLVVSRARTSAVLFGAVEERPEPDGDRQVAGLMHATCFSHIGIRSAQDAAARDVALVLRPGELSVPGLGSRSSTRPSQ